MPDHDEELEKLLEHGNTGDLSPADTAPVEVVSHDDCK